MNPAATYILESEEPYRSILLHLQGLVEKNVPTAQLLFKYRIPFYYLEGKRPFCYLKRYKDYVDIVFWHGTHLTHHLDQLVSGRRKHFKSLRYFQLEEIDDVMVTEVLLEAYSYRHLKYYK